MYDLVVKSVYTVETKCPLSIGGIVVRCRFRVAPLVTYL